MTRAPISPPSRRATVHDVARRAGVSLASVDRVLNGRAGVGPVTREKVERAVAALGFSRDLSASLLARGRPLALAFVLPDGDNEFMASLADAVAAESARTGADRLDLGILRYRALDPGDLGRTLDALSPDSWHCAIVVAEDTPESVAAMARLEQRGVAGFTLVSDIPTAPRRGFIGIDNRAAGRTAASLLGRFCAPSGAIAVLAGSMGLRDHADRYAGFRTVMTTEYPALTLLEPLECRDDNREVERQALALIDRHEGLSGIYNLGAGNRGLLRALDKSGRGRALSVVVHELSPASREGLIGGTFDVVLDQNPHAEVATAIAAARAHLLGKPVAPLATPIAIGVHLRDTLLD